jgi:conjugal transfer pilus assembly protein TraK
MMMLMLLSLDISAAQLLQGDPDETLHATASRAEPTLVRVEGRHIARVYGAEGDFTAVPDSATGAAYIKPMADKSHISLFITDESKHTWKLLLSITDKPADTIIIKPKNKPGKAVEAGLDMERNRAIKHVILALESPQNSGMEARAVNRVVPLWNDVMFVLTSTLDGRYTGEKYRITNTSSLQLVIDERELYRAGVVAVSVEQPVLNPGEVSDVFIILENPHEQ